MKYCQGMLPIFVLSLLLLLLLALLPQAFGIKCFLDTVGMPEPEPGEIVNTTSFRHFDCNLLGGEEKVSEIGHSLWHLQSKIGLVPTIYCNKMLERRVFKVLHPRTDGIAHPVHLSGLHDQDHEERNCDPELRPREREVGGVRIRCPPEQNLPLSDGFLQFGFLK